MPPLSGVEGNGRGLRENAPTYRFRGRPAIRCLFGPLIDASVAIGGPLVGLVIAVVVARWLGASAFFSIGALWLLIFEVRAYRSNVQADASGVTVTNTFLRYRIAWENVNGIWVRPPHRLAEKIVIERHRRSAVLRLLSLDPITVYASVGASSDANIGAAQALIALAAGHGFHLQSTSEHDISS